MKKIKYIILIIILTFAHKGNTFGGIDVPKLPGVPGLPGGVGGGGLNVDALTGKQSQLVKSMSAALLNLTEAQSKFLEALGEKEAAIAALMYVDALKKGEGIGKDDLEKALNQTKKSQQIIEKKILEQKVLDAESKSYFCKRTSTIWKRCIWTSQYWISGTTNCQLNWKQSQSFNNFKNW